MNKLFAIMATLMLMTGPVLAKQVTIDVPGELTDQQKAELQLEATKKIVDNPPGVISASAPEKVKEWVDIGTAIGSGLASSAKELGIAANEFANTPVGKFTVFMIAWHFIGQDFVSIAFGFAWLITAIPI